MYLQKILHTKCIKEKKNIPLYSNSFCTQDITLTPIKGSPAIVDKRSLKISAGRRFRANPLKHQSWAF